MDIEKYNWSDWSYFQEPRNGDYLNAPFGMGLYQLKNVKTLENILFGVGNNCAYRMSSLLPKPFGQGTRNNESKRQNILENIEHIQYRTIAFTNRVEMEDAERAIKKLVIHKFST